MQRRIGPRAYVRLHGRIPGNRGPCSTFRRTSPEGRGEMNSGQRSCNRRPQEWWARAAVLRRSAGRTRPSCRAAGRIRSIGAAGS